VSFYRESQRQLGISASLPSETKTLKAWLEKENSGQPSAKYLSESLPLRILATRSQAQRLHVMRVRVSVPGM